MNTRREEVCFAMGNEAFTHGAIAAGARFYGGYPITPSSEIAELSSALMPEVGGIYIQMEDEIGSIASVIGASASGAKAYTATSGPGFSLMQEELGIAIMAEVPCVIVDVQRNGPSTGIGTKPAQGDFMQARWGTHGDHGIIVLSPSSVQECYDHAITAFNLAEKYRTPVIFLMDGVIGHLHETYIRWQPGPGDVVDRKRPNCPPNEYLPYDFLRDGDGIAAMAPFGSGYIQHLSGTGHDFRGDTSVDPANADRFARHYVGKIADRTRELSLIREYGMEDADCAIVAFGCSVRSAREAAKLARRRGMKVGVVQLITLWPFPDHVIDALCSRVGKIVVPEMNLGQLVLEVGRVVAGRAPVVGVNKVNTEMVRPMEIVERLAEGEQ